MADLEDKIENGGLWIEDFDHATPTFDTHISVHPLSRITSF